MREEIVHIRFICWTYDITSAYIPQRIGIYKRRWVLQNSSDMSITRHIMLRFRQWHNQSGHFRFLNLDGLFIPTHVECRIRLRLLQPNASTALNVTLFHEGPNRNSRTLGKEVAISGLHHDNISVICLKSACLVWPYLDLKPWPEINRSLHQIPSYQMGWLFTRYNWYVHKNWPKSLPARPCIASCCLIPTCLQILIIHGTSDVVTSPTASQQFYNALPASDKKKLAIRSVSLSSSPARSLMSWQWKYHELHNENDGVPKRLLEEIISWIKAAAAAASSKL